MSSALTVLTIATAAGCAVAGGALFAFSNFVMPALARIPTGQAVAAMNSINVKAPNPLFMAALFGSSLTGIALAVAAVADGGSWAPYAVASAVVFLLGTSGMTMAYHVPRNNRLAAMDPESREAAGYWPVYLEEWTRWNHVRSAAGIAASGLLMVALHVA